MSAQVWLLNTSLQLKDPGCLEKELTPRLRHGNAVLPKSEKVLKK